MKYDSIYIASPFFNPTQVQIVEDIKSAMEEIGVEYYSPKDANLFENFKDMDPKMIFSENVVNILNRKAVVVVTDGKDVGTIFEAGFAYAKQIPIVYVWLDRPEGAKFNLMLSQSGRTVVGSINELKQVFLNDLPETTFDGLQE
jgi:nucleoside 2-deoxyribosyltransferase